MQGFAERAGRVGAVSLLDIEEDVGRLQIVPLDAVVVIDEELEVVGRWQRVG